MTKPMKVTCNESCNKTFALTKFLTQKLDGGIEKVYFVCPHCQHEYVAYYTDAEIRGLQELNLSEAAVNRDLMFLETKGKITGFISLICEVFFERRKMRA